MIVRDPKVLVLGKGHVAVCTREGRPIFGAKGCATTREAVKKLRRLVDNLLEEHEALKS